MFLTVLEGAVGLAAYLIAGIPTYRMQYTAIYEAHKINNPRDKHHNHHEYAAMFSLASWPFWPVVLPVRLMINYGTPTPSSRRKELDAAAEKEALEQRAKLMAETNRLEKELGYAPTESFGTVEKAEPKPVEKPVDYVPRYLLKNGTIIHFGTTKKVVAHSSGGNAYFMLLDNRECPVRRTTVGSPEWEIHQSGTGWRDLHSRYAALFEAHYQSALLHAAMKPKYAVRLRDI